MYKKISLIGAGNIGGTIANLITLKKLVNEVVLLDVSTGMAKGKALDLKQANAVTGSDVNIIGTSDYKDIADSAVIIITAGIPRKPGMTRDDLLSVNTKIIKEVGLNIKNYAPEAFVIVVTNPLDAMVWVLQQVTGINPKKIVGMAGVLDGARFCCALSKAINISVSAINTLVIGSHGDTMVPLPSYTSISGIPLLELVKLGIITLEQIESIVAATRGGGAEIVKLMQTGSAYYAPAVSALKMAEAYLYNHNNLISCSAYLDGEYGFKGIYLGVPVVIGNNGVEKIVEINLTSEESACFTESARSVITLIDEVKKLL